MMMMMMFCHNPSWKIKSKEGEKGYRHKHNFESFFLFFFFVSSFTSLLGVNLSSSQSHGTLDLNKRFRRKKRQTNLDEWDFTREKKKKRTKNKFRLCHSVTLSFLSWLWFFFLRIFSFFHFATFFSLLNLLSLSLTGQNSNSKIVNLCPTCDKVTLTKE